MNKYFLLTAALLIELTAFGIGNPLSPALESEPIFNLYENLAFKGGYRGCFVYNRKMHTDQSAIRHFSIFSNEGILSLNFARQAEFYIYAGSNNMALETSNRLESLAMKFNTNFIAGFGATSILYQWHCHNIGRGALSLTGQYEDSSWTGTNSIIINGENLPGRTAFRYREGTVSLSAGQQVGFLVPYVGLNWSSARVRVREDLQQGATEIGAVIRNSRIFGFSLGVSLVDVARMMLTAEVRIINESGMSINADFHF
ncbi:MAG: hypothetical protein WCN87_05085 [Chlamydiota bacterium]